MSADLLIGLVFGYFLGVLAALTPPEQPEDMHQSAGDKYVITGAQKNKLARQMQEWKKAAESNSGNHIKNGK